jgi:pilus assembly protein Flp/PilA
MPGHAHRRAASTSSEEVIVMSFRADKGQGLAEYALVLALIALVVITAVALLGTNISAIMDSVANGI